MESRLRRYDRDRDRELALGWFAGPHFYFGPARCPWALSASEIDTMLGSGSPVYIIEQDGNQVGLAHCQLADLRHRSTTVEFRLAPGRESDCLLAAWQAVGAGWASLPVRRMVATVFGFDLEGIWLYESLGFSPIGVNPDGVFAGGRYWDIRHYVLSRSEFEAMTEPRSMPGPRAQVPDEFSQFSDGIRVRGVRDSDFALLAEARQGRGMLLAPTVVHAGYHENCRGCDLADLWMAPGSPLPAGPGQTLILMQREQPAAVLELSEWGRIQMQCRLSLWVVAGDPALLLTAARDYCFRHRNLHRVAGLMWAGDDLEPVLAAGFKVEGTLVRAGFAGGRSRDLTVAAALRSSGREGTLEASPASFGPGASWRPLDEADLPHVRSLFDREGVRVGLMRTELLTWAEVTAVITGGDQRWGVWCDDELCGVVMVSIAPSFPAARLWTAFLPRVPIDLATGAVRELSDYLRDHVNLTRIDTLVRTDDVDAGGMFLGAGFTPEVLLQSSAYEAGEWHDAVVMARHGDRTPGEE